MTEIAQLHQIYCECTDRDMAMDTHMVFSWEAWKAKGWTADDLRLVVRYIKHLIKLDRRRPESFRFYNLIQNTERFTEDLCDARAWKRQRKDRPDLNRAAVLRATSRIISSPNRTMSTGEVMAQHELMAKLLKEYRATL